MIQGGRFDEGSATSIEWQSAIRSDSCHVGGEAWSNVTIVT